jgi:hypothetical protein
VWLNVKAVIVDDAVADYDRFAVLVVARYYAAYVHRDLSSRRGGSFP